MLEQEYPNIQITLIQDTSIKEMNLAEIFKENKKTLFYFYPKDNTSGCTLEARAFTLYQKDFLQLGIHIIGVSKDSPKSHCSFIEKQELTLALISDENLSLHKYFNVWIEKSMYGRKYMGAERSTFLLDENGNILKEWRNIKAAGHAEMILGELKEKTDSFY